MFWVGRAVVQGTVSGECTNCDPTNVQKPEASAEKMYTWPLSLIRIPKQTSAPHILLYSDDFFIRLVLRRSRFWRINFLLALELFGSVPLCMIFLCVEFDFIVSFWSGWGGFGIYLRKS
jgi:hypothetical protein